jgi:hypothetical protein
MRISGNESTERKDNSTRQAAPSEGLPAEIEKWRMMAVETRDDAWAFLRNERPRFMEQLGVDPKLVADRQGHTLDVNQSVCTQSPVESQLVIVNQLEQGLLVE